MSTDASRHRGVQDRFARVLGIWAVAALMPAMAMAQAQSGTGTGTGTDSASQATLSVWAAGSLRAAITQIAADFQSARGIPAPRLTFGASGLLRDRLAGGERADVFASANMEHPQALHRQGVAQAVVPFARNELCALANPAFAQDTRPVVAKLLDARYRLGTSTPKADPSGDYAFEMFERIERSGSGPAGSAAALKARALQLTGGPQSPPPPVGRSVYGMLVAQGQADVFITYCTNAVVAVAEEPQLQSLPIPAAVNVSATYGVVQMNPPSPMAQSFIDHLLGPQGQARLRAQGFAPVAP